MKYNVARWRCFDRCLLGLKKYKKLGLNIRFLTLTLPACNCCHKPVVRPLNYDVDGFTLEKDFDSSMSVVQGLFRRLYWRLNRLTVYKLVVGDYVNKYVSYLSVENAIEIYGYNVDWKELSFKDTPYFAVRTGEGNGVVHVVLACDYIPFKWLMTHWVSIAGTCYIWINDPYSSKRFVRFRGKERSSVDVAHYLMCQYVGFKQPSFRYGWSRNWVYDGFSRDYDRLRSMYRDSSKPPLFVCGNLVVYPVDYDSVNYEFDILMDKNVYHGRFKEDFKDFMVKLRDFQSTGNYFS